MSSRALRRIRQDVSMPDVQIDDGEVEDDLIDTKKNVNFFHLLDDDNDEGGGGMVEESVEDTKLDPIREQRSKKSKKKKAKKSPAGHCENNSKNNIKPGEEEDIDACVAAVDRLLAEKEQRGQHLHPSRTMVGAGDVVGGGADKPALAIDYKHLDPENELRRLFGSRVVSAGDGSQRRKVKSRGGILAQPKSQWPPVQRLGLSMIAPADPVKGTFTFTHNREYRATQELFFEAIDSMNPDRIGDILYNSPYHIDALLQLSDVLKMQGDVRVATDLIERALYAYEFAFHSTFNIARGHCRLDFRRQENRGLFVALFRYIQLLSGRGCYRSALEFCKVLLSLDPVGDPMGVLLQIDFYALVCGEFTFLIELYNMWEGTRNLSQLPNFAFSVPLAMFLQSHGDDTGGSTDAADLMLQNSLLMFPGVLLPLLDKCSVNPDPAVDSAPIFTALVPQSHPPSLIQLINLYVGRTFHSWKDPDVMRWLETNVRRIIDLAQPASDSQGQDRRVADFAAKRQRRYPKAPRNVLRHVFLSEIKEATVDLPQELASEEILSFDPLPPVDAINVYPEHSRRLRITDNSNFLSTFLRSLLPTFDVNEPVAPGNQEGGAAGGGTPPNQASLVAATRRWLETALTDVLSGLQLAEPLREDGVVPDDARQRPEEHEHEEDLD